MNWELLRTKLKELETPKRVGIRVKYKEPRYFTEYEPWKVKQLLDVFLNSQNITKQWSSKRKGYVIECPGYEYHSHRDRPDDCVIFTTTKENGFVWISGRCRHSSCWGDIVEYIRALNQEWGEYLNAHYTA